MIIAGHPIGVCSWSLRPNDMAHLVAMLGDLGIEHLQLSLGDLISFDEKRKAQELSQLRTAGIQLTAGMIAFPGEDYSTIAIIRRTGGLVPDDLWPIRRGLARESARIAFELGMKMVSTHIGFVPPASDSGYCKMIERTRIVAEDFAELGVDLLMETGPEPAEEMRDFIGEVNAPNLFVNFDPANMILYGAGDPIQAFGILASHIRHIHLKDAIASSAPRVDWGTEVPFGAGQIDAPSFFEAVRASGYSGPFVIEREAGNDRMADVRHAIQVCQDNAVLTPEKIARKR